MSKTPPHVVELWSRWTGDKDKAARDALIVFYVPLVGYQARKVLTRVPPSVELDDLMSTGYTGLIGAVDRFDPERGVPFEGYALQVINGAILEGLRSADWVPRKARGQAREIDKAYNHLEGELGRAPSWDEVGTVVGMSAVEVRTVTYQVGVSQHTSSSFAATDSDIGDLFPDVTQDMGFDAEIADAGGILAARLGELPPRERAIATMYYFYEMTPTEIGKVLGVSESRVCQLHPVVVGMLMP